MRLDKLLSNTSDLSRKQASKVIKAGEVLVNGKSLLDPSAHVPDDAILEFRGMELRQSGPRYFMMNKPEGFVCSTKDRMHPTVLDIMDEDHMQDLMIVGRLDIDTTGLVLITDDGQWSHRITSPSHRCDKIYRVSVEQPLQESYIQKFEAGIQLHEEKRKTLPAKLEILSDYEALLTIQEGKYHQVKRMFAAVENKVIELHREQIGSLELDEELEPSQYRELTPEEVALF